MSLCLQLLPILAAGHSAYVVDDFGISDICHYLQPLVAQIWTPSKPSRIMVVIRSREVCTLVAEEFRTRNPRLKVESLLGGVGTRSDAIRRCSHCWDVLFAMPGRLAAMIDATFPADPFCNAKHLVLVNTEEMLRASSDFLTQVLHHLQLKPCLVLESKYITRDIYEWLLPYMGPHYVLSSEEEFAPKKLL